MWSLESLWLFTNTCSLSLCKKESQLQSKKTDFSQEKSRKSQKKVKKFDFSLTFLDWNPFFFDCNWLSFLLSLSSDVDYLPFFHVTLTYVLLSSMTCPLSWWLCSMVFTAHCDLLRQWLHCSCDSYCLRYSIVPLEYKSCLCSLRLDFFHCTVLSTLVVANRLKIPTPPLPDPT